MIAAVFLAVLLAGARPGDGRADAGASAADASDGGGADAGEGADSGPALDPADEDLVRHLDEVERQELLEQLELFEGPDR